MAIRQALTLAHQTNLIVIQDVKTTGKTTDVIKSLADNKLDRKVLLVVNEKTPELIRATNNIQQLLLVRSTYLSVYHILNADHIVIAPSALATIKTRLVKEEA